MCNVVMINKGVLIMKINGNNVYNNNGEKIISVMKYYVGVAYGEIMWIIIM